MISALSARGIGMRRMRTLSHSATQSRTYRAFVCHYPQVFRWSITLYAQHFRLQTPQPAGPAIAVDARPPRSAARRTHSPERTRITKLEFALQHLTTDCNCDGASNALAARNHTQRAFRAASTPPPVSLAVNCVWADSNAFESNASTPPPIKRRLWVRRPLRAAPPAAPPAAGPSPPGPSPRPAVRAVLSHTSVFTLAARKDWCEVGPEDAS